MSRELIEHEEYMRQREFIAGLAGAVIEWPVAAIAQRAIAIALADEVIE